MKKINLIGMTGLGDSFHQRSIVKYYLKNNYFVQLNTPWPELYCDLICSHLNLIPLHPPKELFTNFETSKINMEKSTVYDTEVECDETIRINYHSNNFRDLKLHGSYLSAMYKSCGIVTPFMHSFEFKVPDEWKIAAIKKCKLTVDILADKKLLVVKPITYRSEWKYSNQRNPYPYAFNLLYQHLKANKKFFTISVCSLSAGEIIVEFSGGADMEFHNGELNIKELCGLFSMASLVYGPVGFSLPMSQSIGTSSIHVFGGRENSIYYNPGNKLANTLCINPIIPCNCFDESHQCDKKINIPEAVEQIKPFLERI